MYDVITMGSATVDVFTMVDSELIMIKTSKKEREYVAYPVGSKVLINNILYETGGGATNVAVSLSKLGLKVACVSKLGSGTNSKIIKKNLSENGVSFLGNQGKEHTGYSFVLNSIDSGRTILAYKGANNNLLSSDIDLNSFDTKWFYFTSMIGKSWETMKKVADYALKKNIKIAFNPSNYVCDKGQRYLAKVLKITDILFLNLEEAELLTRSHLSMVELMKMGPKSVVITNGVHGAYTIDKGFIYHVLTQTREVKQATGAGDAFGSSFLFGKIKGHGIEHCLSIATLNSVSVISKIGAKKGLLPYSVIEKQLQSAKPTILKEKI